MPETAYKAARDKLLADRDRAAAQLEDMTEAEAVNRGEFLPVVASLREGWYIWPPAQIRELLGTLVREVRVTRTGIRRPPKTEVIPVWAAR